MAVRAFHELTDLLCVPTVSRMGDESLCDGKESWRTEEGQAEVPAAPSASIWGTLNGSEKKESPGCSGGAGGGQAPGPCLRGQTHLCSQHRAVGAVLGMETCSHM